MNSRTGRVFLSDCPTRLATEILGDTWTPLVVHALGGEPRRHGEIQTAVGGISRKVLTETLRRLEGHGLVERRHDPSGHPEYRLTELGRTLLAPIEALTDWAREHADEITTFHETRRATDGA
ncbi:winged helix-turn-helix transcriptional regulator [Pseudonocardia sp. HH130629-09]|uniref:winged helix-turn-helix transcriptional regulator n=1 Tax=Pseudonocardia sp. HH130629-09 TaxID=1641402 RepID=UPI0006CB7D49|nr:helix-turn-helix domain-containing protein [Pseudonocardia sp. HH130629-09]ALE84160.1 HxlR family transcriptional regulator [Pseudonocardia sp. HH130629-09]